MVFNSRVKINSKHYVGEDLDKDWWPLSPEAVRLQQLDLHTRQGQSHAGNLLELSCASEALHSWRKKIGTTQTQTSIPSTFLCGPCQWRKQVPNVIKRLTLSRKSQCTRGQNFIEAVYLLQQMPRPPTLET